jgi:hypothetical protein
MLILLGYLPEKTGIMAGNRSRLLKMGYVRMALK